MLGWSPFIALARAPPRLTDATFSESYPDAYIAAVYAACMYMYMQNV